MIDDSVDLILCNGYYHRVGCRWGPICRYFRGDPCSTSNNLDPQDGVQYFREGPYSTTKV